MTAPAALAPYKDSDEPTWSVDTLTVHGGWMVDALGREWGVEQGGEDGWAASSKPRTQRTERSQGDGDYRSPSTQSGKPFSLGGYVWCPTPALREHTELELAALCLGGQLYEYRRITATHDMSVMVERDDAPLIKMLNVYMLRWNFAFYAPDPRKHGRWQERLCTAPGAAASGLDFSGAGLDFSGAGLEFGSPAVPIVAELGNYGTAPAFPFLIVRGPCPAPTFNARVAGWTLSYSQPLLAGEDLLINLDEHPARGLPARTVRSTLRGDVRSLCSPLPEYPSVEAQASEQIVVQTAGAGDVTVLACLRSAWW